MSFAARVVLAIGVLAATAHADPDVGSFAGGTVPPLGSFGTMAVGRAQPWFFTAVDLQGGLRVGPLALIGEGEVDAPVAGDKLVMVRGGADLRLSVLRDRSAWTGQGAWQRRTARDLFVEAGVGEQSLMATGMTTLSRPDVELGAGVAVGTGGRRQAASRGRDFQVYARLRVLAARSPADPALARCTGSCAASPSRATDLGVFVDIGALIGS